MRIVTRVRRVGGETRRSGNPDAMTLEAIAAGMPLLPFRALSYSARSLLMVSSIALAVWSEYPWNLSATIPFLLMT